MSDPHSQLTTLHALLAATSDPAQRAALQAAIVALEATQLPPSQTISGNATVGVAVAGSVTGNIYINGYRTEDQRKILAAYLQRLITECDELPLHALTDTKSSAEQGGITLQMVYTQLVTNGLVPRKIFEGENLKQLDFKQFVARSGDATQLPGDQLRWVRFLEVIDPGQYGLHEGESHTLHSVVSGSAAGLLIDHTDYQRLAELAQQADRMVCYSSQLVTEAIAEHQRLVLLGEPGSGKSTALRYLALSLARIAQMEATIDPATLLEGWSAGRLIPVYLPLLSLSTRLVERGVGRGTAADLWNALAARLNSATDPKQPAQFPGTAEAISHELREGRVLVLLDGLDEVVSAESRQAVIESVRAFAKAHPACRMVVACRVRAYEGQHNVAWQLAGWPSVTLADWTPAQMQAFIRAWYTAAAPARGLSERQRDDRIAALQLALSRRTDLRRLGERPLLLTIMALVHLSRDLPEDRASLYRVCIEKLLAEWERRGKEATAYGALTEYIGLEGRNV